MWWVLGAIVLVVAGGALALQYAAGRNGPAVLDRIDRTVGGGRDTVQRVKAAYGPSPTQSVAVYGTQEGDESPRPVLLFVHGGSWAKGSPDDYGFFARAFVPEGFVVVLAGYRLRPESVFPGMLQDTAAALAWTRENIAAHGGDPNNIVLVGHSAGAYNVVMTTLDRQWLGRVGLSDDAVAGVVGLSGPYDFYPFDSESTKASFGGADNPQKTTQPVAYARGDAPPMLLMTGDRDETVEPRNTYALADALRDAGGQVRWVTLADADHARPIMLTAAPWRRDRRVVDAVTDFARRVVQNDGVRDYRGTTSVPVQATDG